MICVGVSVESCSAVVSALLGAYFSEVTARTSQTGDDRPRTPIAGCIAEVASSSSSVFPAVSGTVYEAGSVGGVKIAGESGEGAT